MFNLQGSEIIIVLLLALVVLGPEKLPDAMRKMGQAYAELKKMSAGFQNEFRSAVDEPMREIRDTANTLRDSADFTKLEAGEREEKPKSAEMAPADPDAVPTDDVPTFETPTDDEQGPELAADSRPAPFSGESSTAPRPDITKFPAPTPFTGMSAPEPDESDGERSEDHDDDAAVGAVGDDAPRPVGDVVDPDPTAGTDRSNIADDRPDGISIAGGHDDDHDDHDDDETAADR